MFKFDIIDLISNIIADIYDGIWAYLDSIILNSMSMTLAFFITYFLRLTGCMCIIILVLINIITTILKIIKINNSIINFIIFIFLKIIIFLKNKLLKKPMLQKLLKIWLEYIYFLLKLQDDLLISILNNNKLIYIKKIYNSYLINNYLLIFFFYQIKQLILKLINTKIITIVENKFKSWYIQFKKFLTKKIQKNNQKNERYLKSLTFFWNEITLELKKGMFIGLKNINGKIIYKLKKYFLKKKKQFLKKTLKEKIKFIFTLLQTIFKFILKLSFIIVTVIGIMNHIHEIQTILNNTDSIDVTTNVVSWYILGYKNFFIYVAKKWIYIILKIIKNFIFLILEKIVIFWTRRRNQYCIPNRNLYADILRGFRGIPFYEHYQQECEPPTKWYQIIWSTASSRNKWIFLSEFRKWKNTPSPFPWLVSMARKEEILQEWAERHGIPGIWDEFEYDCFVKKNGPISWEDYQNLKNGNTGWTKYWNSWLTYLFGK